MEREERTQAVQEALRKAGLDALVCALPANVLLLTGYWPVVGTGLAVAVRGGPTVGLVPEDEKELAEKGRMDEVRTFRPASLDEVQPTAAALRGPLADLARDLGLVGHHRIGWEQGETSEPASYAAMHLYAGSVAEVLKVALGRPELVGAGEVLADLRATLSPAEVEHVRKACAIAGKAFNAGARALRPGRTEVAVAADFQAPLSTEGLGTAGVERAGGFVFCMSGPNASQASGAYARSRARRLTEGDPVLVHCNSYVDGFWTDVTRTYCLGRPAPRLRAMYEAVFAARTAALAAIRPGVRAAEVDRAARSVLAAAGMAEAFEHATGHGVGFAAIDAHARPRLHPRSPDVLEVGMVFNVEPAVYFSGFGGLRHCDVVTVTPDGAEVLTPFQAMPAELVLGDG